MPFVTWRQRLAPIVRMNRLELRSLGHPMDTVLPFRRRVASRAVIAKLVELGYLRPAKRDNEGVVEHAVDD
jgi:hypothetical protein